MKINEFIRQFNERFPDEDKAETATKSMVDEYEIKLGYKLPDSFKEFLMNFSNGIFLLMREPIGGVSKTSPCGDIDNVKRILPTIPDHVFNVVTNEWIDANRLISFTTFDAGEVTNDHWVFICEDGVLNNEYRVGYITQSTCKIVVALENFEEWIRIYWENNKDEDVDYTVFQILVPSWDERAALTHD